MIDPLEVKKRLFSEKTLTGVLRTFESAFPVPLLSKWLSFIAIVMSSILAFFYYNATDEVEPARSMAASMVNFGLLLSTALLGVAIAGFSIFAASLDGKVVTQLVASDYKDGGPNNLSFIFSSFTYVLVALFGLLITSLTFILLLDQRSLIAIDFMGNFFSNEWQRISILTFMSFYFGQLIFVFSVLKSFIWNLHQVLMVIAAARILEEQNTARK